MPTITKIKKATFKHIEAELYHYHDTLREIEKLRKELIFANTGPDENVGGSRGNLPGNPTEQIGTKLATHKRLNQLEEIVSAIERVYERLPGDYKRLVELKYWTNPQLLTWDGIADKLHISKRQAMRWRDEIVSAIAEALGWR